MSVRIGNLGFFTKRVVFSIAFLFSLSVLPTAYPIKGFGDISTAQIWSILDLKLPSQRPAIDHAAVVTQMDFVLKELNDANAKLSLPDDFLNPPKKKNQPKITVAALGGASIPIRVEKPARALPHPKMVSIVVQGSEDHPIHAANVDEVTAEVPIQEISRKNKPRHKVGVELYGQYKPFLEKLRAQYGVDPAVIMGIWGIETNYGANFGRVPVRQALISYARMRPDRRNFVNGELAALQRLTVKGKIKPDNMSSFAGAVGHTQFIPTSIEKFAVDGDGDGQIDLWTPKDALASTANYLARHGWKTGQPWGYEIHAPAGVFSKSGARGRQPMSYWVESGVRARHQGTELPKTGHARLQRFKGRNYLLFDNFFVIMTYNHSTEYAYQVAALGDQVLFPQRDGVQDIALSINGPDTGGNWSGGGGSGAKPAGKSGGGGGGAPAVCDSQICKVQKALKAKGYYSGAVDGSMGPQLQKAIAKYQVTNRLPADGRITSTLTRHLY